MFGAPLHLLFVIALFGLPAMAEPLCQPAPLDSSEQKLLIASGRRLAEDSSTVAIDLLNASKDFEMRGRFNEGVCRVRSSLFTRPVVLKIAKADHFAHIDNEAGLFEFTGSITQGRNSSRFLEYLSVHKHLGDMGIAPKLLGVIEHAQLKKLVKQKKSKIQGLLDIASFSSANLLSEPHVGLLMEEIPFPQPLSRDVPRAVFSPMLATWCEAKVIQAVKEIIEIRRRLILSGIFADDQQVVVEPNGHAYLIDLDSFKLNSNRALQTEFNDEIERLIVRWEESSNEVMDMATYNELKAEANRPVTHFSPLPQGEWRANVICEPRQRNPVDHIQTTPSSHQPCATTLLFDK